MTSLSASALDDDPQGCALLKQAIASKDVSTEGAVGRPVLTDTEVVVSAIAQLGRPNDSKDEVYDRLLSGYKVRRSWTRACSRGPQSGWRRTENAIASG